ncbi:MAG: ATP-binding protein, partial [Paracoccaceae bacterium]
EWIPAPLFPGYLFVALDVQAQRWRAIHSTIGVRHLVCHGDWPAPVPAGIVEEIQAREDEHGLVAMDTPPPFDKGEMVRITAGVFCDQVGLFDCATDNERIVILQVFIIATLVSVALSVLLANTIASPIRRLAEAADPEGTSGARPLNPERIEIPDMTNRTDEIGDLSAALIRMTEALYRRIEAIEAFAADVAHEIKNPLTSVRSAVETMEFARTPEQQKRLLEVIQKDVQRLDRLVTDISNASRLDAELVRERMLAFDLGAVITALADMIRSQGEERDVTVVTHLPKAGLIARGLEVRIAQVVTNLLENALSFAPDGSTITVTGMRLPRGMIRVTVEDQGPGIPMDNLESIFERFYSERPSAEAFGNHSGLGLSISKQIVDAHGGRIWAENIRPPDARSDSPSEGARFVLELPA